MSKQVVLERSYTASIEDVWWLWTTKEGFESWWGPQEFHVEVTEFDARVGGALAYDMVASGPNVVAAMKAQGQPLRHATRGTFTEVVRHQRLSLRHVIDFLPGVKPYDNDTTVEFFTEGATVRMVVRITPYHDELFTRMATEGWTSQLTKVPDLLARRSKA